MTGNISKSKGFKGDKGDALTYEQLTPEQKESLRGKQGLKGDTPSIKFTYDEETGDLYYSSDGILIPKEYVDSNDLITTEMLEKKIASLVNSAPETLDTLNELADALGNDPNFATTISTLIGSKADKSYVDEQLSSINSVSASIIDGVLVLKIDD